MILPGRKRDNVIPISNSRHHKPLAVIGSIRRFLHDADIARLNVNSFDYKPTQFPTAFDMNAERLSRRFFCAPGTTEPFVPIDIHGCSDDFPLK